MHGARQQLLAHARLPRDQDRHAGRREPARLRADRRHGGRAGGDPVEPGQGLRSLARPAVAQGDGHPDRLALFDHEVDDRSGQRGAHALEQPLVAEVALAQEPARDLEIAELGRRAREAARGVDLPSEPVEQDQLVVQPPPAARQRLRHHALVGLSVLLAQRLLDLQAHGRGQGGGLRRDPARRPGDVHDAEDRAVRGIDHRRRRAGPALDLLAEMLDARDADRPAQVQRRADRVGADRRLQPASAGLQVVFAPEIEDPRVAHGVHDDAGGVAEQQHGVGVLQQIAGPSQAGPRRRPDPPAAPMRRDELRIAEAGRRLQRADRRTRLGSFPGSEHDFTDARRHLAQHTVALPVLLPNALRHFGFLFARGVLLTKGSRVNGSGRLFRRQGPGGDDGGMEQMPSDWRRRSPSFRPRSRQQNEPTGALAEQHRLPQRRGGKRRLL